MAKRAADIWDRKVRALTDAEIAAERADGLGCAAARCPGVVSHIATWQSTTAQRGAVSKHVRKWCRGCATTYAGTHGLTITPAGSDPTTP